MKKLTPEQKQELLSIIEQYQQEGMVDTKKPLRLHRTRYDSWDNGHKETTEMFMMDFMIHKSIVDIFDYHYYQMIKNLLEDIKK